MNINFKTIPARDAQIIKQTLSAALSSSREEVLLGRDECINDLLTDAEITQCQKILFNALNSHNIELAEITSILGSMNDLFDTLCNYPPDDSMSGKEYVQRMFGIEYDREFQDTLIKYIDMQSESKSTITMAHCEVCLIIDALKYAAEQTKSSNGDIQAFCSDSTINLTPEDNLSYADCAEKMAEVLLNVFKEGSIDFIIDVNDVSCLTK